MAAPTFVASYSPATDWTVTTTPLTQSVTVAASDVLVVLAGSESNNTLGPPTGGSLTYTLQQSVNVSGFASAYGWTALPGSGSTFTMSTPGVSGLHWGDIALRFSGTNGVGASAKTNSATGNATVNITTTQANSAIAVFITDWSATSGASRTWTTVNGNTPTSGNGLELNYTFVSGSYTTYTAYYPDAGAAGSKTVGITAPTGLTYSVVAIEILGTSGAITGTGSFTAKNPNANGTGTNSASGAVTGSGSLTAKNPNVNSTGTNSAGSVVTPVPSVLVLPTIYVEVGLAPDNPVQPGGAFLLSDVTNGVLGTSTLGTSITWSSFSADVISFSINRPSTRVQGPLWNFGPGTCSILLDNSDGTYDPDNASGPFYGELSPMVPVRIRADFSGDSYYLYDGFADGWFPAEVTYQGEYMELTLSATDAFKVLANITLPAATIEGVGADTGARVKDILTRSGWYTSAEKQNVDVGSSKLQGTTLDDNALNLMQIAVDSEIGQLYVNGSGAIVFRSRQSMITDANSNTVQAVFGDSPGTSHTAGTELSLSAVTRAIDDTTIVNDIQATRVGGTLQEVTDAVSIGNYLFPRSYQRSDLILQNDSDALNWAQWVLYVGKAGENRFETIKVNPLADPYNLWPQVLSREIGDRIQVWVRPKALGGASVSKDCFIVGIQHDWNSADSTWVTTYTLQDATKYGSFFTLDNSTTGKLNSNALTF